MPQDRLEAIDISTQLAIAAGIEALRDAGIPLVMAYKPTSTGSTLPDRWKLPEALADETGVIFASAFPGLDRMADETDKFYQNQMVVKQIEELRRMAALVPAEQTDLKISFEKRIAELEAEAARLDYHFDRRFIFRVLTMGHSQFAEYIGRAAPTRTSTPPAPPPPTQLPLPKIGSGSGAPAAWSLSPGTMSSAAASRSGSAPL